MDLPPAYNEKTIWHPDTPEAQGVFAYHFGSEKRIEYYLRWWYCWAWPAIMPFVKRHERAHAWGIRECLSGSRTCIMFEDDDTWAGKLRQLPWKLMGMGRFCPRCREFLRDRKDNGR